MTLAVGSVPTAQLPAVPSNLPNRPPTPPPRHYPCRNFQILKVSPHTCMSLPMEAAPASPPLSHFPPSSEVFPNLSPSPPPPPPSYSISELSSTDLPPPPPLTLWQEMASPCYMCCYDPPSPEIKSEYDPKLPPGFFSTPDIFPSSPPPPPVPPPPRSSPPPPPPQSPLVCHTSRVSSPRHNATTFSDTVDFHSELAMESRDCDGHLIETCSNSSLVSSSTLTATYFQSDSSSSPLPPHVLRTPPLSTDAATLSSQVSTDRITPPTNASVTPDFLSPSQEYISYSNISGLLSGASVLKDTLYDASTSLNPPLPSLLIVSHLEQQGSSTQSLGSYRRTESIKSEDGSSIPSEVSYTITDTAGPAIMASPLSTDIPSVPSLPTDLDSVSSGLGSLTADIWSFSTEVDSQLEETLTIRTKAYSSSASDTAYTTAESEAVSPSFTASCTITPMPSDYLTPLFSSPAPTPVQSPLPSPLSYLHKSESPSDSGKASLEPLQIANGEFSLTSPGVHIPQANSLEHRSSSCHSFTSLQDHCSDPFSFQPPLSQITEQCMDHTQENSGSTGLLSNLCQPNPDNNSPVQRTSHEEKTGYTRVPYITASLENEQSSDQIIEAHSSDVMEKEEESKEHNNNETKNRESANKQNQGAIDSNLQTRYNDEEHHAEVGDAVECREDGDSHVVKDVNGNVSYLSLGAGHGAQLEEGEDMSEKEIIQTQTMKSGSIQAAEVLERKVEIHDNISLDILKVQSAHSSPVLSPSLLYSPGPCNITPSHPDISSDDSLHLPSHNEATLVGCNVGDTALPNSGTASIATHCSPASPKPEPCRITQVLNTPKEAMALLDEVVINLEHMSADLPASPTSRYPDLSLPQAAPITVVSTADQSVAHIPATSKMPVVGGSQDGDHEELKVEPCHLPKSSPIHVSPPHLNPTSSASSSHTFPPAPTTPPHACMNLYFSRPSTCVSSPCPLLTNDCENPVQNVSPISWDMLHQDSDSFPSSCSSGDYTNTASLVNNNNKSASKEEILSCSHGADFQDSLLLECETLLPSLCSSSKPGSLLDGQPSSSPAPRSKTPPTPPPRSCHNTPRSHLVPPLPPVRQYMLVPINHPLGASRQPSPPPAPPRSTSVHRSSPPPPPRPSAPHLPSPVQEWNKGPPLPPPPFSSSLTPPQPALTPVPEESSNPQSPVLSKSPQLSSLLADGVPPQASLPPDSLATSQQLPSESPSLFSCGSENPPALPSPPEDEQEEEDLPPPPPPPPLIELDEAAPLLPLPSPPPHVLFSPPSLISSTSGKSEVSTSLCAQQKPAIPGLCVAALHTNLSSAPSSEPDVPSPAVDDVAIPPPPKIPNITASPKAAMPNSQAVDTATASSPSLIPVPLHAPPSSPPLPPCAPSPNMEKVAKSPLITTSPYGKMVVVRSDLPLPTPEEEVRVAFTAAKDWGFLAESEDTLSVYTQLRPIIQQGPQCGLVALSMASQVFPQTVEVEELQVAGRALGVTRHGEMFSTMALAQLAEKAVTGVQAEVRRDVLSSPATLLQVLLQGDLVLVPYDAEKNHQPGQMAGHKAHWGVVCGCLVQSCALTFPTTAAKLDSHVDNLWHLRPRSRAGRSRSVTPCPPILPGSPKIGQRGLKTLDRAEGCEGNPSSMSCSRVNTPMLSDLQNDNDLRLVILWRQGKSRKVVAAPLDQLCESNDQLVSFPPPATPQEAEYVIGSVQEGLAGQVVVLHKTKAALSDLVGLLQEK